MPGGKPRKRVYVSSTFIDLKEHRAALKVALERGSFEVDSMERYPAFDERPLDKCLNDVAACDAYVLLLAYRYGYRPEVEGQRTLSITEREYRHAREQGKPCFVFCMDEEHPWPPKLVDKGQDGEDLAGFREQVAQTHGLRTFTDPDNLAHQVLAALSAHIWPEVVQTLAQAFATGHHRPAAWDFGPYMAEKRKGFEGRDWLFGDIAAWLSADGPPALLVRADFGVGKSAFTAELVHRNPDSCVIAYHFCQHDTQDTLHPGQFVRSVAAQLAKALPAYKTLIEEESALQDRLNRALEDPGSAFEGGVLAPLARLPSPDKPKVLLIDALDEALELDAQAAPHGCGIVDLLAAKAGRFPAWLRVLATTRSNPQVLTPLQDSFRAKLIDAESIENLDDLRHYVLHQAAQEPLVSRLREAQYVAQDLAELLISKSEGKFLLAVRALRALSGEELGGEPFRIRLDDLAALPPGMDSWYLDAFKRRYERVGRDYELSRAVLGVLAAAREPLLPATVATVLGVDIARVKAVHCLLPDFLRLRANGLAFDHFSLADWLIREDNAGFPRAGNYAVDLQASHQRLRTWALGQVSSGRAHESSYLLRHLAAHLTDEAERRQIYGELMLKRFAWLQARLDQDGVDALLADLEYIKNLPEQPLLEAVLHNGAHVLRAHPEQLAAQVLGRVGNGSGLDHHLGRLVRSIHRYLADPANQPSSPLLPTGRSLRLAAAHVVTLEGGWPLAVLPDGRIASGAVDGSVRVWDPQRWAEPRVLHGHTHRVRALTVLPDGRIASGGDDRTVRVWDPQHGAEPLLLNGHTGGVRALAVLPDGRIASGADDRTVRVWDPQCRAEPLLLNGHKGGVRTLAVLPNGRIASGADDGTVAVWNPQRWDEPLLLQRHAGEVYALAVLPDGRIASGADDGTVLVWDLSHRHPGWERLRHLAEPLLFKGHTGGVRALAVLPDGCLASGGFDGTVLVWELLRHRSEPLLFEGHTGEVRALAALPDGRLASAGQDGTVRVWDLQRRAEPLLFEGHAGEVYALGVLCDGRLASGSEDHTVRVWDLQRRAEPLPYEGHTRWVRALAVLPDGPIASGGDDRTVRVWDPQCRVKPLVLKGHKGRVRALAALPDKRIVSGADDGTVAVWDAQRRDEPILLRKHAGEVYALAVLPDGRLASGADDGTVRVWDLPRRHAWWERPRHLAEPLLFKGHTFGVKALAVLSDGRLVSGGWDGTVRVWDPQGRAGPCLFQGHTRCVRALALLLDGRIASSSDDYTVRVWDPQHQAEAMLFKGHTGGVKALAVLPDGRLASGSEDHTVRVWDPQHQAQALLFKGHTGGVRALAVLPDGRIASGAADGTVRVWDLARQAAVREFYADTPVTCLAVTLGGLITVGCGDGAVHFLRQAGV